MKSKSDLCTGWLLAAGLAFGACAAHAANGVTITESEAAAVKGGMSATEVEQVLGRPARIVSHVGAPGPTWTYRVVGAPFGMTDFDVTFGADSKVLWASERIIGGAGR